MRSQDRHGESRRCQAGQEEGRETAARVGEETAGRAKEPGGAVERFAEVRLLQIAHFSTLRPAASACQHFSISAFCAVGWSSGVRSVECVRLFWREDGGVGWIQLFARSARSGLV